ncbi:MAG: GNAT family N-acetyltransferase [Nocardioidaceae bacterium]
MEIRRVDPDDGAAVDALSRINIAAESLDPYPTPYSREELREELRNIDSSVQIEAYLGYQDDRPVVAGDFALSMSDNTDKAWLGVGVEPDLWQQGFGSAMAKFLLDLARERGRSLIMASVTYPFDADESHPYRRFVTKQGFSFSQSDVHRVLILPVESNLLDGLIMDAEPHHRDYTFAQYDGVPPAEIRDDFCVLLNQILTDAPSGEMKFEEGGMTATTLAELYETLRQQRRTAYTTVALDTSGVPVAHSQLVVPEYAPRKIFQWDTMVRRDHRGHRLGMATKARNLLRVSELHPDRTSVHTWNAESNTHMIAVNEAMGFVPVSYHGEYLRRL